MTVVREAADTDVAAIAALHVAAVEAFGPDAYDDEGVAAWAAADDPPAERYAVEFYERAGYERDRRVVHETSTGVELDCVRMRKTL